MHIDLLKNIVASFAGEKAKGIVELLSGKKNVDEFLIAKKLNITVNQARNLLYRLADEGIVSFTKKKDNKKGGWYIYSWTLNEEKSLEKAQEAYIKIKESLNNQIQSKKNERFFACPNGDIEVNEENALLHQYTCPECGEILQIKDNTKEVIALEKEIIKIDSILATIGSELGQVKEAHKKVVIRRQKAEERKKKKTKSEARKLKGKKPAKIKKKKK